MEHSERSMFLKLAWLPPDTEFLGVPMRPLSIASEQALRLMGLRVLDRGAGQTPQEIYADMTAYLWLHREPVDVVARAIWSGTWRATLAAAYPSSPPSLLLEEWAIFRERLLSLLDATEITIRPRPSSPHDERIPGEVVAPDYTAHEFSTVARVMGGDPRTLLWEFPLYQIRQIYHAEMRWNRVWTVRPAGPALSADAFEGFGEAVLGAFAKSTE